MTPTAKPGHRTATPPPEPARLLIVAINYGTDELTAAFARDFARQLGAASCRLLIVDNTVRNILSPRLAEVVDQVPNATLAPSPANLGYFGGAAWGLGRYLERRPLPEWIAISNTDLTFADEGFFSRLFSLHGDDPPGVLAPSIRSEALDRDQNPFLNQRPSRRRMRAYRRLFRFYPIYLSFQILASWAERILQPGAATSRRGEAPAVAEPRPIYAPHGSFILFHRRYFEAGGSLDYGAFLFGEEIFVAETARELGLRVLYDPRLVLKHRRFASTGGTLRSRKLARYHHEAITYLTSRYFG